MSGVSVRRLDTYEELLEASGRHPVVELDVGRGFRGPAWAATTPTGSAVAFPRRSDHGVPGASVLGDADALEVLLGDRAVLDWFATGDFHHLGRPRALHDLVERLVPLGDRGGDWDWMWTTTPPPHVDGEERVLPCDASDAEELTALLTRASPRTHGQPFVRDAQRWVGVRTQDRIVACGCAEPSAAGVPVLSGIAVESEHRGEGLGRAVTAALAREAVATTGACVLGMYADNDVARGLYERLGFRTAVEWRSRWVDRPT
ncbi:GNAT family N-acetyltransferase [Phycicoccus sp. BSK3Z-2]|uniref:GNAT family N-acetyltransferase n=1 Tax=Phycicoccus avicenniae TaxID=2828860 RepID=A0A941D611_9MICO|nr:GNAT family N-acetyltransferase [Phycicoccus avicenniae]MBR7742106.1 GNAT family N-acetyltransferase [Phycicoccus avicenniae]